MLGVDADAEKCHARPRSRPHLTGGRGEGEWERERALGRREGGRERERRKAAETLHFYMDRFTAHAVSPASSTVYQCCFGDENPDVTQEQGRYGNSRRRPPPYDAAHYCAERQPTPSLIPIAIHTSKIESFSQSCNQQARTLQTK